MIRIKRVYETPSPSDGARVLVDRLWPRGLTKGSARIDHWPKELAPSPELRRWYGHDRARFSRFRARYRVELLRHREALATIAIQGERASVTLVYAARDSRYSNAAVLKELLEEILTGGRPDRRDRVRSGRSASRSAEAG